jgi:hypothetical protein
MDPTLWRTLRHPLTTALGLLGGIGGRYRRDRRTGIVIVEGGPLAAVIDRLGFAAITIGNVIHAPEPLHRESRLYRHEAVHVRQAAVFGDLYLPVNLAGYLVGFLRDPKDFHGASPLEQWAEREAERDHGGRLL